MFFIKYHRRICMQYNKKEQYYIYINGQNSIIQYQNFLGIIWKIKLIELH